MTCAKSPKRAYKWPSEKQNRNSVPQVQTSIKKPKTATGTMAEIICPQIKCKPFIHNDSFPLYFETAKN